MATSQLQYSGSNGTAQSSKQQWVLILEALAADKKTDLHPGAIQLWQAKLRNYPTNEIKNALLTYRGQYMPSCDEIIEIIEQRRSARASAHREKFEACGKNGCVNGWRPSGPEKFGAYQRCKCLLDHMAGSKRV